MSRTVANFVQADVARALRAAEQTASGRYLVEIAPGGVIRIIPVDSTVRLGAAKGAAEDGPVDPFARGLGVVP
jgi:hypothetical protein